MRMFFGSLDQHGKGDGVITMQEWLKIMGQLGDKVRESPDPHHHAPLKRTEQPRMQCTRHAGSRGPCHAHTPYLAPRTLHRPRTRADD